MLVGADDHSKWGERALALRACGVLAAHGRTACGWRGAMPGGPGRTLVQLPSRKEGAT